MAKASKKTGKGRLDKYYKLAKEQGYRARSAFKLIQLNKKYSFLESARCCIDLCAAPGGWLQVASKYMAVNSIIVGVDLIPIKPIPRVITLTADITTPQCRNLIRNELKDWKADIVLHDGAPNVGTAWVQDAYNQSELVLMSLKLAVEFLAKGGTFVTKVFRSLDYNNLIWVFNQLFEKVEATKPPSSRNVSAEIFVVCREFRAPKYIDPKFLDSRHVFKELAAATAKKGIVHNAEANVFQPGKQRRKRDGYDDNDYTLFKKSTVGEFVKGTDPISILGSVNKLSFETEEEKGWLEMAITTSDVKANCDDLKVLGKGDFKALLKWRLALREELGVDLKKAQTEEVVEIPGEVNEDQQVAEELERHIAEAAARTKRERRRAREIKARTIQRMQLKMTAPLDIGLEQNDASLGMGQDDIFDLGVETSLRRKHCLPEQNGEDLPEDDETEDERHGRPSEDEGGTNVDGLEAELDGLYEAYQERLRERDLKYRAKEARKKVSEKESWKGFSGEEDNDESGAEGGWEQMEKIKEQVGEDSSSTESSEGEGESESKPIGPKRKMVASHTTSKRQRTALQLDSSRSTAATQMWFNQEIFSGFQDHDMGSEGEASIDPPEDDPSDKQSLTASDDGDEGIDAAPEESMHIDDVEEREPTEVPVDGGKITNFKLDTAEAMTLAMELVNRKKTKTQLINEGFNRYSLNSKEGLPVWFLDDEAKYYKPNLPITKEAVAAIRSKQRALDVRPIKKVAEAKARKKLKAHQRLAKATKMAEGVNATSDMTEREKARQIEKLMRRGMSSGGKAKKEVKVVVAKGAHKGLKGRPKGVKGRYVMVDARMKKEVRSKKRKEKAKR